MTVTITVDPAGIKSGKVADAALHFDEGDGVLAGLRLLGFAIWERTDGGHHISMPARRYTRKGAPHSYVLLQPIDGRPADAYGPLVAAILSAYDHYLITQTRLN